MTRSEIRVQVRWRHARAVHSIIVRSIRGGEREFVTEAEAGSFARIEDDRFAREQKHAAELYVARAVPLDGEPIEDVTLMHAVMPEWPDLYFGVDASGTPLDIFGHDDTVVEALVRASSDPQQVTASHGPGRPGA